MGSLEERFIGQAHGITISFEMDHRVAAAFETVDMRNLGGVEAARKLVTSRAASWTNTDHLGVGLELLCSERFVRSCRRANSGHGIAAGRHGEWQRVLCSQSLWARTAQHARKPDSPDRARGV